MNMRVLLDAKEAAVYSDVIVVQGRESGGHGQNCRSLSTLIPATVDLLGPNIPVLAAGGCSDGRGLASALALGASGVVVGSRYCCTPESLLADSMKKSMLAATGDDTIRSPAIDLVRGPEWPFPYDGRLLSNALTERWRDKSSLLYEPTTRANEKELYQQHVQTHGNLTAPVVWCGEGIDSVTQIIPAAQCTTQITQEAIQIIQRLQTTITTSLTDTPSTSTSASTSPSTKGPRSAL